MVRYVGSGSTLFLALYVRLFSNLTLPSLSKSPTDLSRIPHQSLRPTDPSTQLLRSTHGPIRRRILILHQRFQKLPYLFAPRIRRIIVDREHTDRAETSAADNSRLAGQGAIAIDAGVGSGGDNGAVTEQAACGIKDGGIDFGAARHAGLDEWRVDAFGVLEGGDFGIVHSEAVYFGISLTCLRGYSESVDASRDVALGRCFSFFEFCFTKDEWSQRIRTGERQQRGFFCILGQLVYKSD